MNPVTTPESSAHASGGPRRHVVWLLAISCFLAVFGARIAYVDAFGSDLPMWDQWDSESARLILPFEQGRLRFIDLFEPHNEHRIVLTKLLALGLYVANGQWDARLECVVNGAMMGIVAVFIFLYGRSLIAPRWHVPWWVAVLATCAAPLSFQNITGGFHTQQTLLIGLSMVAAHALLTSSPGKTRWYVGAVCCGLALFTMASGLLAAASVVGTLVLTSRGPIREILRRHGWTLALCLVILGIGASLHHPAPHHEPLKAHSVTEFIVSFWRSLQWPVIGLPVYAVIGWLPWAALTWRVRMRHAELRSGERVVVAAGVWVLLQYAASAYARGAGGAWPADRYFDTIALGIALNALALLILVSHAPLPRWGGVLRTAVSLTGLVMLTHGWWNHVVGSIRATGPSVRAVSIDREYHTRAFVHTGNRDWLRQDHIPHPSIAVLHGQLSRIEIARALPAVARRPIEVPGMDVRGDGFSADGIPEGLRLSPGWPAVGSFPDETTGVWTSGLLPEPKFGYWLIPTATQPERSSDLILTLETEAGAQNIPLRHGHDLRLPGAAWNLVVIRAPRSQAQLRAEDHSTTGWLAVGAPLEMAVGSHWAWRIAHHGLLWLGIGLVGGLVASVMQLAPLAGLRMFGDYWRRHVLALPRGYATASFVAGALGAAIAAFFLSDPRETAFFVATMRGDLKGNSVELFYDRGRGIRGGDAAQCWLDHDIHERQLRLALPPGNYKRFRFDPMDFGAVTTLERPRIEDANGSVLRELDPSNFVAGYDMAELRAEGNSVIMIAKPDGDDPQVNVRLDAPIPTVPRDHSPARRVSIIVICAILVGLVAPLPVSWLIQRRSAARGASQHTA